jgi:aspartyl-tRNA(Asn)/glutamyl-tRNA(Gln) amidotransferase subunit C
LAYYTLLETYLLMSLQISEVERLAHLARLHLSPDEASTLLTELNGIFGMIEQLQAVDTTGLEPMSHPLGGAQRLREDVVTETPDREANLRNAPAQQDGLFLVPKVIE